MQVDLHNVRALCARRGGSLTGWLQRAGVSRNAFYTLARQPSVVPRSLTALAEHLGVPVSALLTDRMPASRRARDIERATERTARRRPGADRDNIRHTLLLLEEKPVDRLRGALRRGQKFDFR